MKTDKKTQSKISSLKRRWHGRSPTPPERRRLYTALGCIIFATCLGLFYTMGAWNALSAFKSARPAKQAPAYINANVTVTAGAGSFMLVAEQTMVREFEDGTRVELPAGAKLWVEYTPRQRLLRLLAGAVTVEVAKDPRRPLSVQANQLTATAVGTKFGVTLKPIARVDVIEGTVAVVDGPVDTAMAVKLGPGESYTSDVP